jgi:hypothetical protein
MDSSLEGFNYNFFRMPFLSPLPPTLCVLYVVFISSLIGQLTYEKVNEELFFDKSLHVILNKSKLAYRIYVIQIANKELKKSSLLTKSHFSIYWLLQTIAWDCVFWIQRAKGPEIRMIFLPSFLETASLG